MDTVPKAEVASSVGEESGQVARALAYGLLAALAGAAVWLSVAIASGYEHSYVAAGIGLLAGFGVSAGSRARRSSLSGRDWLGLKAAAVASAIAGVLAGRLLIFFWATRRVGSIGDQVDLVFRSLGVLLAGAHAGGVWSRESLVVYGFVAVFGAWKIVSLNERDRRP